MEYPTGGESTNETALAMLERFGGKSREEQVELVLHMALIQVMSDQPGSLSPLVSREVIDASLSVTYEIKEAGGLDLSIVDYLLALLGGNEKTTVRTSVPALMRAAQEAGAEDGQAAEVPVGGFASMTIGKAKLALVRKIRGFTNMPGDMATSMGHAYMEAYKDAAEEVSPN